MTKVKLGDILELKTKTGKVFLHYVKDSENKNELELVRVYYKIHSKEIKFNKVFITENDDDFFFLSFPVKSAVRKKILKSIYNAPLENRFEIPNLFRTENIFGGGWNIIDKENDKYIETGVLNLTEQQKKMSPWATWNDTLLIENLEKGWRLENWN
jgi:hypothetical protein